MRARLAAAAGGLVLAALLSAACGQGSGPTGDDAGTPPPGNPCVGPEVVGPREADRYADRVVAFTPGAAAGFGQDLCPNVVLGPPDGRGAYRQSLDVLSLGRQGVIVLEFTDIGVVDEPGVDLLVFENAMSQFPETGVVAVSDDGSDWREFPCAAADADGGYPGCAGVHPVYASPDAGISATDPAVAGGDGFDLATVGLSRARFVRITDTGANAYAGVSGGFDLDAIAVVNGAPLPWSTP